MARPAKEQHCETLAFRASSKVVREIEKVVDGSVFKRSDVIRYLVTRAIAAGFADDLKSSKTDIRAVG